jgi:hypothetical protein
MYQTTCIINNTDYPLDFTKASTKDGDLYYGVLFTSPAIEFRFTIDDVDKILPPFQPITTPLSTQTSILKAIREYNDPESGFLDF